MGKGPLRRTRAAFAAIGTAVLISLAVATPAGAAPEPNDSGSGQLAITLGTPEKATTLTDADTGAGGEVSAQALDCAEGFIRLTRTESCSNLKIPVVYTVNGTPAGRATLHSKVTSTLNPRNRYESKYKVELRLTDPSSWAGWVTNGRVGFECNHCDVNESGEQLLFPNQTRTYEFTVSSPGRALVNDSVRPYATLDAPRHDEGSALIGETFRPRCDSTPRITPVGTGGCVYPDVAAVWVLDTANPRVDAVAWHVDWAQRNLDQPWGKPGTRYALHRTFDDTIIDANRDVACGRGVPRPPPGSGLACDEYPFAQSLEGASRNPDYSCHFLDGNDNSREGSLRKASLNGQRVLEGDAFYVRVLKAAGAVAPPQAMGPVGCGSD
ncbi:hypothetical protein ACFTWH_06195 [Streptomyces sp. NPDC057011]|uniref:NucA/NucB deoxyribonuclease domain-containing protein n=1 Tax=unclassified Streptomyces TaxID=2593676 RepID=UPI0036258647